MYVSNDLNDTYFVQNDAYVVYSEILHQSINAVGSSCFVILTCLVHVPDDNVALSSRETQGASLYLRLGLGMWLKIQVVFPGCGPRPSIWPPCLER